MLRDLSLECVPACDISEASEVDETGETLEENSLLKARALGKKTPWPVLADDTGLFVERLNGAPGVRSARYAGLDCDDRKNVAKLLEELRGARGDERKAFFRTGVTILFPGEPPVYLMGEVAGRIVEEPKGKAGFGYDPVFEPEGFTRTFAEMTAEEKNEISHRGRAFAKVREFLSARILEKGAWRGAR